MFVFFCKRVDDVAVDVNLANVYTIYKKRNHNFRLYGKTAGNVIVLCADIRNNKIIVGNRNLATNSLSERDNRMVCFCTYIRAKMKGFGLMVGKIKTYP